MVKILSETNNGKQKNNHHSLNCRSCGMGKILGIFGWL